ncbi:MAG: DUF3850 domain-containing protein [Candidatus Pacearchaeota archaeon]
MEVEKKTWPEMFEKILLGEKKHEIRLDDFEIKKGDFIVLKEWDPDKKEYTGREVRKKVGFVTKINRLKYWNEEDINKFGFVVMDLE